MLPKLEINGPVARITLQRPQQANRLQAQDVQALQAHVAQIDRQQEVRLLLLRAQGRHFCGGYDIASLGEIQPEGETGSRFGAMVDAVQACRAVTLAAIHGGVYGGATDMALACDFRLGSDKAEMFMPQRAGALCDAPGAGYGQAPVFDRRKAERATNAGLRLSHPSGRAAGAG